MLRWGMPFDLTAAHASLEVVSLFSFLLAAGRCLFLLIAETTMGPRLVGPMPKIFWDILQAVVYVAVLFLTLRAAGVEPGSLLTTSALLTAVVGLSLQDTLGNLFAGLSIQAQRPFDLGDWVQFDDNPEHTGRVLEINWRATKVITIDDIEIIIPNALLARAPIRNYTKPTPITRRLVEILCPYDVSPQRIRRILTHAVIDTPGVLGDMPPQLTTLRFEGSGILYALAYYTDDFQNRNRTDSWVRERIWYALRRHHVPIPFPTRTLLFEPATSQKAPDHDRERREAALRNVDFLAGLSPEDLTELASSTLRWTYGPGETIVRQGEKGGELFLIERGHLGVHVGRDGGSVAEVARLGAGHFFGEISLMTGESRAATVIAETECDLLVVNQTSFEKILHQSPALAEQITAVLVSRQDQIHENLVSRTARASRVAPDERSKILLQKIRRFFSLT